ncbi:DUF5666 domain-containing protein [Patescibacteria group bacterium]|nr:DUF5666 domain-containing protein [Patescibacteria group bacterium]
MTRKFLTGSVVFLTSTVLASSTAFAVVTTVTPPIVNNSVRAASSAGQLQEKITAQAQTRSTIAKLAGTISSLGTNNFVINGVTVNLTPTTILLRQFGARSAFSEFSVGDQVQAFGKWTNTTQTAVNARLVRDISIQKRRGTFVGTIVSTNATGFIFQPLARPQQTVTAGKTTRYLDRRMKTINPSTIIAGHRVMIRGMWDNKLNTITEVTLVKDFSQPTPPVATPSAAVNAPR